MHGTTTDNIEHKSTGWLHGNLSEKGIEQSIKLREQINLNEIDLVISSDLKRAIDSAKYTFKDSKVILHDKRIRECNYGDLNGEDTSLVKYEEHIDSKFPNGESLKEVEKRLRNFCEYLLKSYNGKTIALVSHIGHSIAPVFISKFLVENKVKVKKLIFVCGFNNYLGINEEYDAVNKSMYFDNLEDVKKYANEIICFYSDNDPYVRYETEKDFADKIATEQVFISNAGHINSESGYDTFEDIVSYL